jgi:hypothetical protein
MINPANEDIENWIFGRNVEVFFKIIFEEIQKMSYVTARERYSNERLPCLCWNSNPRLRLRMSKLSSR